MSALPLVLAAMLLIQDAPIRVSLRAERAPTPPTIDGHLDEPIWKSADVGRHFRQFEPREGEPATENTEVRILYDNSSLYVGARLYDSEPDRISLPGSSRRSSRSRRE